jgi:enoyl-CoA hydratase/carnithine racemase
VTTGMVPIAGGMQRLAAHIGRARAARMAMFGDGMPAPEGFKLGFVSHLVPAARLTQETDAVAHHLAAGPTRAYGALRALLKTWGNGGVAAADAVMLDITMDLFDSADARKGFAVSAKAFDENIEPPPLTFDGR